MCAQQAFFFLIMIIITCGSMKNYTDVLRDMIFISLLLFTISCKQDSSITTFQMTTDKIRVDGKMDESAWQNAEWRPIDQAWLGAGYSAEDFSGRYKVLWDKDRLYVIAEIIDDTLVDIHADGLDRYWDDDCLEVFIDVDASGGDHQYNYNAFAYHIALDGKVVDMDVDSLPHYYSHVINARTQNGNMTTWELAIQPHDDTFVRNKPYDKVELSTGRNIGFAIAYCDNDHSKEREHFVGSIAVEGEDKNRGWIDAGIFEKVKLVK